MNLTSLVMIFFILLFISPIHCDKNTGNFERDKSPKFGSKTDQSVLNVGSQQEELWKKIECELLIIRKKFEYLVAENLSHQWFGKDNDDPIYLLLNRTEVLKTSIKNGIKLLTPFISVKRITRKLQRKLKSAKDIKRCIIKIEEFSKDLPVYTEPIVRNQIDVKTIWSDIIEYLDLKKEEDISHGDTDSHEEVNPRCRFLEILVQSNEFLINDGNIAEVHKLANDLSVDDVVIRKVNDFKNLVKLLVEDLDDFEEIQRFDQLLIALQNVNDGGPHVEGQLANENVETWGTDMNEHGTDKLHRETHGSEHMDIGTAKQREEADTKEELDMDTREETDNFGEDGNKQLAETFNDIESGRLHAKTNEEEVLEKETPKSINFMLDTGTEDKGNKDMLEKDINEQHNYGSAPKKMCKAIIGIFSRLKVLIMTVFNTIKVTLLSIGLGFIAFWIHYHILVYALDKYYKLSVNRYNYASSFPSFAMLKLAVHKYSAYILETYNELMSMKQNNMLIKERNRNLYLLAVPILFFLVRLALYLATFSRLN